jgi:hypothetical protein
MQNPSTPPPGAFDFEGQPVVTNARAAEIFGVDTREVTQNIKTNPEKFDRFSRRYAFELTEDEARALQSAGLIPRPGRGGARARPWLLTRKGVMRLATVMRSPRATEAVDILIDVFDEVAEQVMQGRHSVTIAQPSRLLPPAGDDGRSAGFRRKLLDRLEDLLDTVIDRREQVTFRDAIQEASRDTYNALTAILQKGSLQNERTAAETAEILERVRDIFERRMSDLEDAAQAREAKAIQIARDKLDLIERSLDLSRQLEPSAVAEVGALFRKVLPGPDRQD